MKTLTTLICLATLAGQALADPQPAVLDPTTPGYRCQVISIQTQGHGVKPTHCQPQVATVIDGKVVLLKGEPIPLPAEPGKQPTKSISDK